MTPEPWSAALDPARWGSFALVTARLTGLMLSAPLWSLTALPRAARAAITVVLAVLLLPAAPALRLPESPVGLVVPVALELAVGIGIGLAAAVIVQGASLAGETLALQMGLSLGPAAPTMPDFAGSELAHLFGLFATAIYLAFDGHLVVLGGLAGSLRLLPPGGALELVTGARSAAAMFEGVFAGALAIAAPVLVLSLLVQVALALLQRAVPQLNALMTAFPVTIGVGLLCLGLWLPVMARACAAGFSELPVRVESLLEAWGVPAPEGR